MTKEIVIEEEFPKSFDMIKFKKDFPGLFSLMKKYVEDNPKSVPYNLDGSPSMYHIFEKDIMETCLDKQRVKEAINKMDKKFEDGDGNYWWSSDRITELEKELNIE